jgi:protoheme IX farnesyltransferase
MKYRSTTALTALIPGLADYLALIKFRLLALVLVSTCMGYFVGATDTTTSNPLLWVLLGITLVGGGANTLNQWKERSADALMYRTRLRPLPARRLSPANALWFGIMISMAGFAVLAAGVNRLTLLLSLLS